MKLELFSILALAAAAHSTRLCSVSNNEKIPNENDAASYFACQDGSWSKFKCSAGEVFVKEINGCAKKPAEVKSGDDDDDVLVLCPPSDDGQVVFIPHPYNCSKFFMCQYSWPILMICPDGLHFDTSLDICNYPEDAKCVPTPRPTTSTTADPATTSPTDRPEPTVTTTEETEAPTDAPTTTASSSTTTEDEETVAPTTTEEAETDQPTTVEETEYLEEESFEDATTGDDSTTTSADTTDASSTTPSQSTTEPFTVTCEPSVDGTVVFVRHPKDCSKFYACVGLNPVLLSCPDGLFFDTDLNVCNYPDQVDCN